MERKAAFGRSSPDSYAHYDPTTQSLKTHRSSPRKVLTESYVILPHAGTMRNGVVYQQRPLVPHTSARGLSLLPTPMATDYKEIAMVVQGCYRKRGGKNGGISLFQALGGVQSPSHRDWLMGFPIDWTKIPATDIALLATRSFRKSLNGSEKVS
jgi:hypothetical protein